jgi:hypothetical protein
VPGARLTPAQAAELARRRAVKPPSELP